MQVTSTQLQSLDIAYDALPIASLGVTTSGFFVYDALPIYCINRGDLTQQYMGYLNYVQDAQEIDRDLSLSSIDTEFLTYCSDAQPIVEEPLSQKTIIEIPIPPSTVGISDLYGVYNQYGELTGTEIRPYSISLADQVTVHSITKTNISLQETINVDDQLSIGSLTWINLVLQETINVVDSVTPTPLSVTLTNIAIQEAINILDTFIPPTVPPLGVILGKTLMYAYDGLPVVWIKTNPTIQTTHLDWPIDAIPFVTIADNRAAIIVDQSIQEEINVTDLVSTHSFTPMRGQETINVTDSVSLTLKNDPQEEINVLDQVTVTRTGILMSDVDSMDIGIAKYFNDIETTDIVIAAYFNDIIDTNISIIEYNLPPEVDYSNPSNMFAPTIYLGGSAVVTNASTDPGSTNVQLTRNYIHWLSSGISNGADTNEWTDLWNFNFNLNYSGGSFSIAAKQPLNVTNNNPNPYGLTQVLFRTSYYHNYSQGPYVQITPVDTLAAKNLGYQANIFSLKGTILDFGPFIRDSEAGYSSSGIFGTPLLNRQMSFLLYNSALSGLLTQAGTIRLNQNAEVMGLAFQIARICGVTLTWAAPNLPIQNTLKLDGLTGVQAIASLAAQVGATLRWNGNNKYTVAYANQSFGLWQVPDPRLLLPSGCGYTQHMDLETGLTGTGVLIIPHLPSSQNSQTTQPNGGLPQIQRIGSISQKLTDSDPPRVFDLPFNYDKVYIQILIPSGGDTSGTNNISINNFCTQDPTQWFEFDTAFLSPGQETSYIFNTYLGGAYIPQVKIDFNCFPAINSSVDNGHFIMNIACSLKSLASAFQTAKTNLQNAAQQQLAAAFEAMRFIKTYSGTITCQFFGSIPMPGMWGKATIPGGATIYTLDSNGNTVTKQVPVSGDLVVEGIIEDVQFNWPGTITVQVAQYARINYGAIPMNNVSITGGLFL